MERPPKHRLRNEIIVAGLCLLALKGCYEAAEWRMEQIAEDFENIDWSGYTEVQDAG